MLDKLNQVVKSLAIEKSRLNSIRESVDEFHQLIKMNPNTKSVR